MKKPGIYYEITMPINRYRAATVGERATAQSGTRMMMPKLLSFTLLATALCTAQVPSGRWDGTVQIGGLKAPFRIDFEGTADNFKASLVNADARASSTSGTFADGKLRLSFAAAKLDATLTDGELKGTFNGTNTFTASAFCSCGYEGEAGPDIAGTWDVPSTGWRLEIRKTGEDTLATVKRTTDEIGPLRGRFDGLAFSLHYFDGTRAAILDIEPNKAGGLELTWSEPSLDAKKLNAIPAKPKQVSQ